jgi:hypothetical protein
MNIAYSSEGCLHPGSEHFTASMAGRLDEGAVLRLWEQVGILMRMMRYSGSEACDSDNVDARPLVLDGDDVGSTLNSDDIDVRC